MRIIDRKWIDLATGYRTILSLKAQLETEFGRALQVGLEQEYQRNMVEWKKKRRVFFSLVAIAPLSLIALSVAAFYFREMACVIIYWILLVLVILVTLAVAGRDYLRQVINRPSKGSVEAVSPDLEKRWWASLAPQGKMVLKTKPGDPGTFLVELAALPDNYLAYQGVPDEDLPPVTLFGPSGPWLFTVRGWSGDIVKQDGLWKQLHKNGAHVVYEDSPDDEWARLKERLAKVLSEHFPHTAGQIQGGVAFVHPKARIYKELIRGNLAACGSGWAWLERIGAAPAVEGLTLDMQLKALDGLMAEERGAMDESATTASARAEAMRLYQATAAELRKFVAGKLGKKG